MRSAFGVRRLASGEIGIVRGESDCSEHRPSRYHPEIALQHDKRRAPKAKRQTLTGTGDADRDPS
jgi:hypothetical protein